MREWENARTHLRNLKPTLKNKSILVPKFLFEDDGPYVSDADKMEATMNEKVPVITKHVDQTDSFASFLIDYGHNYPRVARAIKVMIIIMPPNSSPVERGYAVLKEIVIPNALQFERGTNERMCPTDRIHSRGLHTIAGG